MANPNRERKLRERRLDKQTKKDASNQASTYPHAQSRDVLTGGDDESIPAGLPQPPPATPSFSRSSTSDSGSRTGAEIR